MEETPQPNPPNRRPWPMTWIVVAIVVYITAYTLINFAYRKPERAHEPWAEAQQRREDVKQEAMLDWVRFQTTLQSSETSGSSVEAAEITRGPETANLDRTLPIELVLVIPARPELARAPEKVSSPARLSAGDAVTLVFEFPETPSPQSLGDFLAYAKDQHLHLFLQDEKRLARDTPPVAASGYVSLSLPADTLTVGEWQATLYCSDATFTWKFVVE